MTLLGVTALLCARHALANDATHARAGVVEMTRDARAYAGPAERRALRRGVVARGARFDVLERGQGPGCSEDWLRIGKDAWVCASHARQSDQPATREQTRPTRPTRNDDLLPRPYLVTRDAIAYPSLDDARKRANETTIRGVGGFVKRRWRKIDGKRFYKTKRGWVPESAVEEVEPNDFRGVFLDPGAREKRLAFVTAKRARYYDEKGRSLRGPGPRRHSLVTLVGEPVRKRGKTLYPVDQGRFVRDKHIGVLEWMAPPEQATENATGGERWPGERWIDVSISEQTLIAYEGERPVFATLVSTARYTTTPGIYRVKKKRAFGRMRARPEYQRQWDVHVPWVMTLDGRLAMHVAYWHAEFGRPYSAGCVNLAPRDAKWIWDFTAPHLPPGWVRVRESDRTPGTIVRIRE